MRRRVSVLRATLIVFLCVKSCIDDDDEEGKPTRERVPYYPIHPLHDPLNVDESKAQYLYRILHKIFTNHAGRTDQFRKALDKGETIGAIVRGFEGYPDIVWRVPVDESDEHFRLERDIWPFWPARRRA